MKARLQLHSINFNLKQLFSIVKGAVRQYCLQHEAMQADMISQPVKLLM